MPIWAGPVIGWLLQRSGGIAIHRGRLDRPALAQARGALAQGRYSLVVAPEGACLLYTSPSPRDRTRSRMPSSA